MEYLFGHKKEWNTDACYNMNESWKHYAKWKKLDTKGHLLYESVRVDKSIQTESRLVVAGGWGKEDWGMTA